jgi:riboflavin synthase
LALTEQGLIQIANAGLVKRGQRDLAAGAGPEIREAADGSVEARFADGTVTRLGPGRMPAEARCTCPASGMCRHRVALVLGYQRDAATAAPAAGAWDPGGLDLAALELGWSAAQRSAMKRLRAAPLTIRLEHGAMPVARLPMATVSFLVPHDIAYARCDCAALARCAHVALAIEAFRAAGGQAEVTLGTAAPVPGAPDLRQAADAVLARLLVDGVVAGMPALERPLDRARAVAAAAGATWLLLALEALAEQVAAHERRSARHAEDAVLALAAELHARTRAADAAAALGLGEAMEVAMAKTRLVSLGARITRQGRELTVRAALADPDTGAAMVLEQQVAPEAGQAQASPEAARRRRLVPGIAAEALARGQLLTSVARRRADGGLVLGTGRGGRTTLTPRAPVQPMPAPLAVADLAALAARWAERPPAFLRPRNRVLDLHVFAVDEVLGEAWAPGAQLWQAAVALPGEGGTLLLERRYDPGAPDALDLLSAAVQGRHGALRQVAGSVRIEGGTVICDPWSLGADQLVIPDLDAAERPAAPVAIEGRPVPGDAPGALRALLAAALHAGRRRDPEMTRDGARLVGRLRESGYPEAARRLSAWLAGRDDVPAFGAAAVWSLALLEG